MIYTRFADNQLRIGLEHPIISSLLKDHPIGSERDQIYGYNLLPETGIERNLGLQQKLHNRIQEIHDTIGEDSAILDGTKQLNEAAMYAIYEQQGGQLSLFEDEEEKLISLNEAEEILRQLRREQPAAYEWLNRQSPSHEEAPIPKIICSAALI